MLCDPGSRTWTSPPLGKSIVQYGAALYLSDLSLLSNCNQHFQEVRFHVSQFFGITHEYMGNKRDGNMNLLTAHFPCLSGPQTFKQVHFASLQDITASKAHKMRPRTTSKLLSGRDFAGACEQVKSWFEGPAVPTQKKSWLSEGLRCL